MRFNDWAKEHREVIEGVWAPLSTIAANCVIVATLLLALATYFQAQKTSQVEASLGYVDTFNGGEVLAARNIIYRSWIPYDFSGTSEGVSREVVDEILARVVPDISSTEGIEHRTSVATIVTFFDSAQACIGQEVCATEVFLRQAGEYARDFHCLYEPIIRNERERGRLVAYGVGLEAIAEKMGGC
jgi:hypothetical protein